MRLPKIQIPKMHWTLFAIGTKLKVKNIIWNRSLINLCEENRKNLKLPLLADLILVILPKWFLLP